ncbi:HK97 family phage prohead protease [Prauserella shujinwangii]|uniref:HK97 family phage prohead protease n=1 Tax=Prauserella shujinwangii TaxID=1453103 RepID=UPI0015E5DD8E
MGEVLTFSAKLDKAEMRSNTLHGHAAVFFQEAIVENGIRERIAPTAFTDALDRSDTDVRALINHDPNLVLGRQSSGTLRVKIDREGLAFEVDLPDTSYANDLKELVQRGDVDGASFAAIPGKYTLNEQNDGSLIRTHTTMERLLDVSAVTYPAYKSAAVALRSFDPYAQTKSELRSRLIRARWAQKRMRTQ